MYCTVNALRQFEPFSEPSGNLTTNDLLMSSQGVIKLKVTLSQPVQPQRSSPFHNYFGKPPLMQPLRSSR